MTDYDDDVRVRCPRCNEVVPSWAYGQHHVNKHLRDESGKLQQLAPALPVGGKRPHYDSRGTLGRSPKQRDIPGQTYICDLSDKED